MAAKSDMFAPVARMGRPTSDPKRGRLTLRLAERDLAALRKVAQARKVPLAEAARAVLREALAIPKTPRKEKSS